MPNPSIRFALLSALLAFPLLISDAAADEGSCYSSESPVVSDLGALGLVNTTGGQVIESGTSVPLPDEAAPGSRLVIRDDYPRQRSRDNARWGDSLKDISSHEPDIIINGRRIDYTDRDHVTHGHEVSHGIHSWIRTRTTDRDNAFYLLNDRYALIKEPNTTISQTAAFVPAVFRSNGRYQTYISPSSQLVKSWNDTPLYTWDEWVAYTNGGTVGVEMAEKGLWDQGGRDAVAGVMEFSVYAVAMAMSVQKNDPESWENNPQIKEFLAYNMERAMDVYNRGLEVKEFTQDNGQPARSIGEGDSAREVPKDIYGMHQFHHDFLTHPSAEGMRQWLRDTYGQAWTQKLWGF